MATPGNKLQTPLTTANSDTGDLATISVSARVPEFWVDMPRLWFAQFESVMDPQKQGDASKYNMVVAKLNRDALQQVGDLILSPPVENKYETIKKRLLSAYEESAERQFHKLVSEMDLESQRPSQLLRKMSELARNTNVSTDALQRLWISRLPGAVKAVLSVARDTKLDDLALIADKVMENLHSGDVASVSTSSAPSVPDLLTQMMHMTLEIKALRNEVNEIRGRNRNRGNSWNRGRSNSWSRRPRRTPSNPSWLCRHHYRFGTRATTCEQPCNWKQPGVPKKSEN